MCGELLLFFSPERFLDELIAICEGFRILPVALVLRSA